MTAPFSPQPAFLASKFVAANAFSTPSDESREQLARLQAILSKKLGPEYLSSRQGAGGSWSPALSILVAILNSDGIPAKLTYVRVHDRFHNTRG
jgi:hypothetical protein